MMRPEHASRAGTRRSAAGPSSSSPAAGAHRLRGAALAFGAACALWLAAAAAGPQARADVLVSNTGQTPNASSTAVGTSLAQQLAQAFTTGGSHPPGFTIDSVELVLAAIATTNYSSLTVSLYTESSGNPGTKLFDFVNPGSIANGKNTFTAPENRTLAANTTYLVVVANGTNTGGVGTTRSDAEDSGGADGWSIADTRLTKQTGIAWASNTLALLLRVNGAGIETTPPTLVSVTKGSGRDVTVAFTRTAYAAAALFQHHRIQTCTGGCGSESNWYTQWTSSVNAAGNVSVVLRHSAPTSGYKRYRVTAFNGVNQASNVMSLNSGADTTAPRLVSAEVKNRVMTLTYNEPLDHTSVPPVSAFEAVPIRIPAVDVLPIPAGGREVKLVLTDALNPGLPFSHFVSYTPPSGAGAMPTRTWRATRPGR